MALEIFKLFGSIYVDNDKANESIAKTDKNAQRVGGTLLKGVGTAAKWGAGIATAAGVGITAMVGMASKTADAAGAIADSSAKAGMAAEEYQKWAYAAQQSGIETSKLDSIMVKSQKSFADAKTGSEKMSEAYKTLGVDINSISNSSDAFDATIAALSEMEDETQRNALANDIFGKSYADLAPLLNEGASGIAALKQEASDMGAVMSNESVTAGEKLGDTFDKLKAIGGGLFNSLGTELIPIAQQFADMIIAGMPMIQGLIQDIAPVISELFKTLVPPIMDLVSNLMPLIIELFKALMPVIAQLLPPIVSLISTAVMPLVNILLKLIKEVLTPVMPLITAVAKILTSVLGEAFKNLEPVINNIMNIFTGLIDFVTGVFTGDWKKAFQGLSTIVKNIFDGLMNIVKVPINFIIDGLNIFIRGLNKLKIPDWVPGVGGKGLNLSEIQHLANGGIASADVITVNENGRPELIGKYGNQTGVMNGEQLSQAVSEIVYKILAPLFNDKQSSESIIVENVIYLGDDKVYKAVKRAKAKEDRRYKTELVL